MFNLENGMPDEWWNNEDCFFNAVASWMADHNDEGYDDLRLVGDPYIDDDGEWTQDAEDDDSIYCFYFHGNNGNVELGYIGRK